MPIHDQGYRRYEAREALRQIRFWPITREALKLILAKRAFLGLLAISFIQLIVRVIQVYVVVRFPEAGRVLPVDGRLFGEFLNVQIWFALLLSIFGASGLIANDLRTGAILVYLSRPLTRRDYVLGKLGVPMSLNLAVTFVAAMALYGVALTLAPDQFFKWELAWIGPAIFVHSMTISLLVSLLVLAVSSLSGSARVAGLGFVLLFLGLEMIRLVLQHGFGYPAATLVSLLMANLQSLGEALFGLEGAASSLHWTAPAAVLVLVALGCLAILRSRVRAVEIVT